ncbi:MAG: hypothetical protein K2N47_00655, partial [Clostridia bacterium]|nr:hypothetical protein [Clostridia bacterium]
MSKKSLSKIKWTKKFTTLFVTLMVGLTAAVSGAAAALGVSMSDKGGQLDNGDNVHYEIGADGVAQPVVDISGNFASGGVKYSSNTTLRLTNDTTLNGDIYVVLPYSSGNNASMTFTLDLNGYVLNMNGHFIRTHFDGTPPSKLNQTYNVYVTDSNPNRKTVYFTQSSGRYVLNGTYGSNDTGATRAIRGGVIYGTDSTAPIVLTQLYTSTNKFVRYEGGQKESADGSIVWYEDEYSYYDVTYTPYLNNNLYLQGGTIAGFKYGVNIPANHYGVEGLYSDFDVMGTKTYVEAVPGTQKIQTNMYDAPGYPNICEYSVYNVTISGSRGDRVYYRGTDFIGNDSNINIDDYSYFDSTSDYSFIVRDNENGQYGLDLSKCTTTKDFGKLSAESEITIIGGYDKARISGVDAKDYLFYFNGGTSNSRGTLYNNNGTLSSDRPSGSYANGYTITAATTSLNYYGYSKYVLGSDIVDKTTSIEVPANAKVKIDLAGHVLATTGSVPAIKINAGATVHIYDSNPEGIIHRFSNSGSYYNFSSGTATFIGGVISAKGSSAIQFYGAGATLSMNGGALAGTYYHGIRSDYDNTNVYLRNVNVLRHDEKGIYLTGANSRLLTFGSMIAGNRKEGIWISQSSSIMKLYRTSVSYNKRTGIVTYANNNYFYDDVAYANPFVNDDCDNYEYDSTYIRPQYNTWGEIYGNNANSDQSGADMGGGIRCYGSLYLEGTSRDKVSVSNNETNGYGGGIYMASSGSSGAKTLSLKYADISNNRANTGDVYWDDDGDDNWDNYDGSGGGIYINGNVNYTQDANTTISGNYAGYSGGGIYYWSNSSYTMTINGGVFSGNTADEYDGGAIYLGYGTKLNCNVTSSNSLKIYNNKAGEDGGAISSSSSTVTMTGTNKNIEIYSNTATGAGAIYMSGGSLSLNNVKIYKNTANDENGALYVGTNVTSLSLVSTEITENKTTDGNYGGFYAPINFTIGGSTIVKSNRACDGEDSDITLAAGKYITISSALTANASNPPIGITFMSEGYAFTSYFGQRHSDRDINKYFYSHSGSYELVTIGSGTATEGYVKMLSVKRPTLATISEYTGSAQRAVNYSDYDIGRFWDATCVYTPFGGTAVSYGVGDTHNFLQDGITNAGTYVFTFTLHGSDHDWDNGTTTAYTLPTITLNKKQIAKPTQANTLTYNATKQAATFTTTGLTYGTDYTASDNEQINAGDYTATLTIASSKAGNYRWSGTTNTASASTTVSYKIDKVTITQKPAQSDTVLYYNGAEQEAKFATAPLGYGNVAMYTIAKATATNAGTYEAIASISDTTNYKWDNSFGATGESDPLTFNWKISPAKSFILDDIT